MEVQDPCMQQGRGGAHRPRVGGTSGPSGSLQTDGRGPLWCPIHNCFTPPENTNRTLYVQYMHIAVYTVLDGHVCLVYSTGGSTHKVHFHLCTYVCIYAVGFTHVPLDHCMGTTTLCICEHMLPPQVRCILGSALWILLLYV